MFGQPRRRCEFENLCKFVRSGRECVFGRRYELLRTACLAECSENLVAQ